MWRKSKVFKVAPPYPTGIPIDQQESVEKCVELERKKNSLYLP